MKDPGCLTIRADAGMAMGTGHVMRCLALAQAWRDSGGEAVFVTNCGLEALVRRVLKEGLEVERLRESHPHPTDIRATVKFAERRRCRWIVTDGYHFDEAYHQGIRDAGFRLLVIDDTAHLGFYGADILMNQNIYAEKLAYRCHAGAVKLLGPEYVLLRKEFLAWSGWKRVVPPTANRILISFGGTDPGGHAHRVIESLAGLSEKAEVRVASGFADAGPMNGGPCRGGDLDVRFLKNVVDMPGLMAWADMAIANAGSVTWELFFMGLPSIFFACSDNQRIIAECMREKGLGIVLDEEADNESVKTMAEEVMTSHELRRTVSERTRSIVDGKGAERICRLLRDYR